jgi:arginine deiminase
MENKMRFLPKRLGCLLSLGLFATALFLSPLWAGPEALDNRQGRVVSDIDRLKSVIILSPSTEERREIYYLYGDSPLLVLNYTEGMVRQHQEFSDLLRKNGVHPLDVVELLDNALSNARKAGKLAGALAEIFPEQYPRLEDKIGRIKASVLLGRSPEFFFNYNEKGYLDPLIPLSGAFFFTRDFAVSTPRGIILTNSRYKWRKLEHLMGRFIFRFADELAKYPVVFDAEAEGVHCEGGDIIIKDERTILMGIGNCSDPEAARKIAQKLNMDVVGVSMPPADKFSGANFQILHLDTVFNLVDRKKALTVPYLFLKRYEADNPVVKYLKAVNDQPKGEPAKGEFDLTPTLNMAIVALPKVGWLTLYQAGSGEARELGTKLGDYLLEEGYEIVPVGGDPGDMREDQYIDERALYELSLQGANVVQLAPGKVVAYAHNRFTNLALERRGIKVLAFEGKYLADSLGGPHCLTMPLVREQNPEN